MIICPSRGRPHNLRRLIAACVARGNAFPWTVRLDDDDPSLDRYRAIQFPKNWVVSVGPRVWVSEAFNEIFRAQPDLPFYGWMADDVVPASDGWDETLVEAADLTNVAYGDDGISGEDAVTHGILGGDMVRELGWLQLPGTMRLYSDTALTDWAKAHDRLRYCPDVLLTHYHFSNGLAVFDPTYEKPQAGNDQAIYEAWRSAQPW